MKRYDFGDPAIASSHEGPVGWERLFWRVFEDSSNPIALLNELRVYLAVNPAACELFGTAQQALVGSPVDRFLAPQEYSRLNADWARLWRSSDFRGVHTAVFADGSRVRTEVAARTARIVGRRVAIVVWLEAEREPEPARSAQSGELTPREHEIVSLVALGLTSPEIAERLVVSPATVNTHVQNAMAKMGARTRAHLVAIALADRQTVEVS
jgi:PAS domain S-box-containing protein